MRAYLKRTSADQGRLGWITAVLFVFFGVVSVAQGEGEPPGGKASKTTIRLLANAQGNADPALPHRLASTLSPRELTDAFYSGMRLMRLIALDAALEERTDPFFVASSLAALMGAEERQTASRAAHALDAIIRRANADPEGYTAVVPGQAAQLIGQLRPLARDPRLDLDIRIVAMSAVISLSPYSNTGSDEWLSGLLDDPDIVVRRSAVGYLAPPLRDDVVIKLSGMVTDDSDLFVRGQAAAMLCENALAHEVKDPSDDLTEYLKTTLQTRNMPIDAIGGILGCLRRFEGKNKDALVEIAIAHPDPAVNTFWKQK